MCIRDREKFLNKKADLEKEVALRNQKIQQAENKLKQREMVLSQRQEEIPVSYTHLSSRSLYFIKRGRPFITGAAHKAALNSAGRSIKNFMPPDMIFFPVFAFPSPVSYTHLDVYKRQIL